MRNRRAWKTFPGLLLSWAILLFAQPAAALDADYWRGGWRTPLGNAPHIYEFVIRGNRVTGVYCRNCSDATTIGFIDGTWDERAGIDFTVTFANPNGTIASVNRRHAMLADGRLIVTGAAGARDVKPLTLVKDPRGPDAGAAPVYLFPPGTPPVPPTVRPGEGGGGGAGRGFEPPYWPPGPFKALQPSDVVGTWIAVTFGPLGMNKQIFTFLLVGDRLRGMVCGRCDNPDTLAAIEDVIIAGDTLYFTIAHEDHGNSDPPRFGRNIAARIVQNEMIASILGKDLAIDPATPPAPPPGRPFTLVGPIALEGTRGNGSEGVDLWGPGTGSAVQPPPGRMPARPANPIR